jgi:replicative DNA helicase
LPTININEVISRPGSERGILSIIVNNPDKILECEEFDLYSDHFSVPGHKNIYSAICYLYTNPDVQHIDALAIYNTITDPTSRQSVDELGGMAYIDSLIQSRVADNLRMYINQVRSSAIKRIAYNLGTNIQDLAINDNNESVEELVEEIQRRVLDLVITNEGESDVYHMGDDAEERLNQRMNNPMTIPGYSMGWKEYDRYTQGHKGNELTVYVAEAKTGKSVMLLNRFAKLSVIDKVPGLYIDTEMTDTEQEDRLLSNISGVPYEEIVNGLFAIDTIYGLGADKRAALFNALAKIKSAPAYHVYLPNFTIDKVTALVRKYKLQHNIGYAIFDYIKLPTSEVAGLATAQEYQRLGFFTTCLKDLSGICDIPIDTAAQSNRANLGTQDPDASNIGGSYRILQMATRLVFLRNKTDGEMTQEGFSKGNQKLIIKYQRNGSSDCPPINIAFDKATSRMREV